MSDEKRPFIAGTSGQESAEVEARAAVLDIAAAQIRVHLSPGFVAEVAKILLWEKGGQAAVVGLVDEVMRAAFSEDALTPIVKVLGSLRRGYRP